MNATARTNGPPCGHPGLQHSGDRYAVIVVERAGTSNVAPIPVGIVAVFGGSPKLFLGHAGDVAAEPSIVFERLPRQRVVIISQTRNPPKPSTA